MARKRLRPTNESLTESLGRLGLSPGSVDPEALRAYLELPEFGAAVEDELVARAVRDMSAARAFVETGIPAIKRAVPALRATVAKDDGITWSLRVAIPLLDADRMDLRVEAAPERAAADILAAMAARNDPTHRLDALRAALTETEAEVVHALRKPIDRLRGQILADLREVGADAAAYLDHMDRSLRSRQFRFGPKLARSLLDT